MFSEKRSRRKGAPIKTQTKKIVAFVSGRTEAASGSTRRRGNVRRDRAGSQTTGPAKGTQEHCPSTQTLVLQEEGESDKRNTIKTNLTETK